MLGSLCKYGLPTEDLYEFSALTILKYEKKLKAQRKKDLEERLKQRTDQKATIAAAVRNRGASQGPLGEDALGPGPGPAGVSPIGQNSSKVKRVPRVGGQSLEKSGSQSMLAGADASLGKKSPGEALKARNRNKSIEKVETDKAGEAEVPTSKKKRKGKQEASPVVEETKGDGGRVSSLSKKSKKKSALEVDAATLGTDGNEEKKEKRKKKKKGEEPVADPEPPAEPEEGKKKKKKKKAGDEESVPTEQAQAPDDAGNKKSPKAKGKPSPR